MIRAPPISNRTASPVPDTTLFRSVLARIAAGMAVHHLEEMAVQMDRMGHHRVVDENDALAFVAFEADRLDAFAEFFAIERPHEALHVAGEMNLDRALRRARVRIGGEDRKSTRLNSSH